jgi:hypothetical protein
MQMRATCIAAVARAGRALAVLFGALVCLLAAGATAAQAESAYVLEQHSGGERSVLTLTTKGLRYETFTRKRAGGKVRGSHYAPAIGVIISYDDGQVFLLDPVRKQYDQVALRSAVSGYEQELKELEKAQPSEKLPPEPGVKQTPGRVTIRPPKARLRALHLSKRIGAVRARAYLLVQGRLRQRIWYATRLPEPPSQVRSLLTKTLGGAAFGSLGRALDAHAAQLPLEIDQAHGRHWRAVLRTVRLVRHAAAASLLAPPHGYSKQTLSAAGPSAAAHAASVPGNPIRCGFIKVCFPGVDGPVSEDPAVFAWYWGPQFKSHLDYVSALNHALEEFTGDEFAGPYAKEFWSGLGQYGVGQGKLLGYEVVDEKPPTSVGSWNAPAIIGFTYVRRLIAGAPSDWYRISDEDPVYAVFVDESEVDNSSWAGYHAFTPTPEGILLAIAIHPAIPWLIVKVPDLANVSHDRDSASFTQAVDKASERASHEYAEATTDPYPFFSWADPDKSPIYEQGEIADICEEKSEPWGSATRLGPHGVAVDPYWSNDAHACVPDARPTARITFPTSNEQTISWGGEETFIVQATDAFEEPLPENEISWYDFETGTVIGHGRIFSTSSLSPGVHLVSARITDSTGGFAEAGPVKVTVVVQPPEVKIVDPANNAVYGTDQFINFRGSAFDSAEGNIGTRAVWSVDGVQAQTGATLFRHRIATEGVHTVTLTATNSQNVSSTATVVVDVGPALGKPSVEITSPGAGSSFGPGEQIQFTASAEALGEATVSEYVWSDDKDGLLGTGPSIGHTLSGSSCEIIEHHVTVVVTDSFGRTASDTITVFDGGIC